jgi:peptidoglycan LD-endopeptidase LytH
MKENQDGLKLNYSRTAGKVNIFIILLMSFFAGCSEINELIGKRTPYEVYLNKLEDSGILNTAAGMQWKKAGENVFSDSLVITLPYKEINYFSPSETKALAYRLILQRGEKLNVFIESVDTGKTILFIDLFVKNDGEYKHTVSAEENKFFIDYTSDKTGTYLLRIQPEILGGGKFRLSIDNAPSLAFPVYGKDGRAVKSFWGDNRDGGRRLHQGVDIFAERGTPVLAAADGIISRTGTNRLGGKVVWLSTLNKSLYYAHLDSQAVEPASIVKAGDTLGFVGNTGNARNTPPHLHFGIYYHGEGAVDPFPYINNFFAETAFPEIKEDIFGKFGRTTKNTIISNSPEFTHKLKIEPQIPVKIKGVITGIYRGELPDGRTMFFRNINLEPSSNLF